MKARSSEPILSSYLFSKASKSRTPIDGAFELSPVCNLRCKMCYVRKTPEEVKNAGGLITADQWLDMASQAQREGMLYLLLTGGEPFIYPGIEELYTKLSRMGFIISFNSNATRIDGEIMKWLGKQPPTRINVTLYGSSNDTYARLCGDPNGFDKAVRGIETLLEAGIQVKLNGSITPDNVNDLEELHRFADEHKLILQATTYMFPPIRRDKSLVGCNERFTSKDAGIYFARNHFIQNTPEAFKKHAESMRQNAAKISPHDCYLEGDKMRCRAGKSTFWISWNGVMVPCGMMTRPEAYPFRDGFKEAWKQTTQNADDIRLSEECANCNLKDMCQVCAAMALTETGEFNGTPKYFCEMTASQIEETERLYQKLLEEQK